MLPKLPTSTREFEEGLENLKGDVVRGADKAVTTVGKDVSGQISPTELVAAMYAPSAKKPEAGSGETGGFADQLTLKPGEFFGNVAGAPLEPGQQQQTESALGQISIPVDKLANTMIGSPIEPGENAPTEDPFEQLLPTANQVGAWTTGSVSTQRVAPHMETAGQQIVPSVDELTAMVGIAPSETSGIPGQRQAPPVEQASVGTAGTPEPHGGEQNPASQSPEVQQMMQQQPGTIQHPAAQHAEIGPVDPAMQMSSDEKSRLDAVQKELREHRMLHDYMYIKGPLDNSPTLQQELAKKQQETKQREEQQKQEEEEEKKRREEEEAEKRKELPEPGTKDKPGNPNIAIGQSQKKTEVHRGAAG